MEVRHVIRASLFVAAAATLASCTDEKIVYRDVSRIDPAPSAAGGFLGFVKSSDSVNTVCGTCHAGRQNDWATTGHAVAWKNLQASGHATAACEACHTLGQLGNGASSANVGWTATKDARYHNVQCESCHGAGSAHVNNPGSLNLPLASADQSTDPNSTAGCGACHQGLHQPYLEEWSQSPHSIMEFTLEDPAEAQSIIENSATGERECQGCHTGEFALRRLPTDNTFAIGFKAGVTAGYKEAKRAPKVSAFLHITCLVCHDPHKNANASQLRFPVATTDTSQQLCIRCHNRRPALTSTPTSFRGPHSGEGQLTFGQNSGWRPPGMPPLPAIIRGTHADPAANPNQCVTCHMASYAINDASGSLIWNTTGHTFNAFPCKNAQGIPVGGSCDISQRSFKGCTGSGCHASETAARSVFQNTEGRVEYLMEELKDLLENTAKVPCSEFMYGKTLTVALGARYNYLLAAGHGAQATDVCSPLQGNNLIRSLPAPVPSEGAVAHNPAYLEQLLRGSITAVKATYYK